MCKIIGIVGCKSLYEEIKRFGEGQEIRLVQQGLHDLPKSGDMREKIQEKVDELDSLDLDYIALIYGRCGGGTEGIESNSNYIVIPDFPDCIGPLKPEDKSDSRSSGTFYLTRGWIDCGNDPLKEFKVILDEDDDLVEMFLIADREYPDMDVDWHKDDKYQRIRSQGTRYEKERLEQIFFKIMRKYDKIEIINNDNLYGVHYEYAELFREFLQDLHGKYGDGRGVDLKEVDGDLDLLKKILCNEVDLEGPGEGIRVFGPGDPVELTVENRIKQLEV